MGLGCEPNSLGVWKIVLFDFKEWNKFDVSTSVEVPIEDRNFIVTGVFFVNAFKGAFILSKTLL